MQDRYPGKLTIEIKYCVVWGYLPLAAWMATEIWHDFGEDAPVTLIPVANGRLEVYASGEKLFDRKAEGGVYPDMRRVRQIKEEIERRLKAAASPGKT